MRLLSALQPPLLFLFFLSGCSVTSSFLLPGPYSADARILEPVGHMTLKRIEESSDLEKSGRFPDTYWTFNDSGGGPRIFAIRASGEIVKPDGAGEYQGIRVKNATNIDWEDMTVDGNGNLYIADCGNNDSRRRNLAVYILPEPDPRQTVRTSALSKIRFSYPEQHDFPPKNKDFDAEALFWRSGHLYLLTKHRSDTRSNLYRFDTVDPDRNNPLTLVDSFVAGGMVTAADASDDGSLLAILTYHHIWLIELPSARAGDNTLLHGRKYRLPIQAGQCEGICFNGDHLLISNERQEIFSLSLREIKEYPIIEER